MRRVVGSAATIPPAHLLRCRERKRESLIRRRSPVIGRMLPRMPGLTAADERLNRPFGSPTQRDRFLQGLRLAGLPEE